MGKTVTKKALSDLKCRNQKFYEALERLIVELPQATWRESLEFTNEIQILIDAYERQIELNKKQNKKIKNQKGILKALQRKLSDKR